MNFCYLHPTVEAEGRCFQCGNWICIHDYNLLEEKVGEKRKNWHSREVVDDEPVVLCPNCFEKDVGRNAKKMGVNEAPMTTIHKTKVLMCFQCGGKITEKDKFCPTCGESTAEEDYDAEHPMGGVQASREQKEY